MTALKKPWIRCENISFLMEIDCRPHLAELEQRTSDLYSLMNNWAFHINVYHGLYFDCITKSILQNHRGALQQLWSEEKSWFKTSMI